MQLQQRQSEIEALDLAVLVVTFEKPWQAAAYLAETQIRWPLLIDESRGLYEAYGMRRGHRWHVWGPPAWWAYAKLLARGRRLKKSGGDVDQLGGDVLVDPGGVVRLHSVGRGPADRPPVDSILATITSSA